MDNITRRLFLRQSAAAGVVAATVATPIAVEAAAPIVGPSDPIFARYVAFLAHEHRAALIALRRDTYARMGEPPQPPMFWFPKDHDVELLIDKINQPERRARAVLHAVGLPIPPKTWA